MIKKYPVHVTEKAENDLRSIHDYISRAKPLTAAKWLRTVRRQIMSLATSPLRCEIIPEEEIAGEYRHLLFGNYRILFRVAENMVFVVRVIHAARELRPEFLEGEPKKRMKDEG